MAVKVDLNCDLGESFGAYQIGNDQEILNYVTSANIACGFHAGDPSVMRKTVKFALAKNVAIGAHPGLPDLAGFGRRNMVISSDEAYDMVLYQLGALNAFVQAEGGRLNHVKPHGALYNMAAKDPVLATAIAKAIAKFDGELYLYGLAGSELIKAGERAGLRVRHEVFADRTYQEDGTLTPRSMANALITDAGDAIAQVVRMIKQGEVHTIQGQSISIQADTVCIHGDGEHALQFAQHIGNVLQKEGIHITSST
ncbi:LamB/YcsF family protein [Priestia koreensis]|uniref:5-oxoprolinase subunit A n=1 Tax=Priestia koreensis TaxID=284581 RepID=A0A0M0LI56_9BACI|nr:5-oxoprolinase subunit PxpA [Priestia koreensis]KOO50388.1 lactam utilization protein LamB [Priestia koreensis]